MDVLFVIYINITVTFLYLQQFYLRIHRFTLIVGYLLNLT